MKGLVTADEFHLPMYRVVPVVLRIDFGWIAVAGEETFPKTRRFLLDEASFGWYPQDKP
jgi:hypothetical protein